MNACMHLGGQDSISNNIHKNGPRKGVIPGTHHLNVIVFNDIMSTNTKAHNFFETISNFLPIIGTTSLGLYVQSIEIWNSPSGAPTLKLKMKILIQSNSFPNRQDLLPECIQLNLLGTENCIGQFHTSISRMF